MQDKNHAKVKKILLALSSHVGVKGIRGLAAYLEVPESNLYSWINRNSIGDTGAILKKIPNARIEFLETGEGEMFKDGKGEGEGPYRHPDPTIQKIVELLEGMDDNTKKDVCLSVQKEKLLRELLNEKLAKKAG